jgi:hypothetical protein
MEYIMATSWMYGDNPPPPPPPPPENKSNEKQHEQEDEDTEIRPPVRATAENSTQTEVVLIFQSKVYYN